MTYRELFQMMNEARQLHDALMTAREAHSMIVRRNPMQAEQPGTSEQEARAYEEVERAEAKFNEDVEDR